MNGALVSVAISLITNALAFAVMWGRVTSKLDELTKHVDSLLGTKETIATFGARLGQVERDIANRADISHQHANWITAIKSDVAVLVSDMKELKEGMRDLREDTNPGRRHRR